MLSCFLFSFNAPSTTEHYTLSLHDALPISEERRRAEGDAIHSRHRLRDRTAAHGLALRRSEPPHRRCRHQRGAHRMRSEEHTSELQSPCNLVCRLLLEKKNQKIAETIKNNI